MNCGKEGDFGAPITLNRAKSCWRGIQGGMFAELIPLKEQGVYAKDFPLSARAKKLFVGQQIWHIRPL